MNHNLKKRLPLVIIFLVFAVGLTIMGYPLVSDWLSRRDKRHIQTLVKTEEQSESTMGSEDSAEK